VHQRGLRAKPETVVEAVFVRIRRARTTAWKSNPSGRREGENVKCECRFLPGKQPTLANTRRTWGTQQPIWATSQRNLFPILNIVSHSARYAAGIIDIRWRKL
jgi:hypothetical protein